MKHADYTIMYNEVMFSERDRIDEFINDVADMRQGDKMWSWEIEPNVTLKVRSGGVASVKRLIKDQEDFVLFEVNYNGMTDLWPCSEFEYGELSKLMDSLPEPMETKKKIAEEEVSKLLSSGAIYFDEPISWFDGKNKHDMSYINQDTWAEVLTKANADTIIGIRNELAKMQLQKTEAYKKLTSFLMRCPAQAYNFAEHDKFPSCCIEPFAAGMNYSVIDVSIEDGEIQCDVCVNDAFVDKMTLYECELSEKNLITINEALADPDVMDTFNAHNFFLVKKINDAWNDFRYRDNMKRIIYALTIRDADEYKEKTECDIPCDIDDVDWSVAHNEMEYVCDDQDLETILSFIRYE